MPTNGWQDILAIFGKQDKMRTLCLFFSFCPWAYATSRLTGMLKYLSIGVSVFNNGILKSLLADCQRLQYLEAQAESTDDTEEHACTWLHAAVLHTRDIRLIGSHALSQFLLGDLLALPCIADNLSMLSQIHILWGPIDNRIKSVLLLEHDQPSLSCYG